MLGGCVGGGIHSVIGVAIDDHRVPPTKAARRSVHLYVGSENRLSRPGGAARLRPVGIDQGEATFVRADSRAAAYSGKSSGKLSTSCSATYLLLTAVRRPHRREVELVSARQLLKKGPYPLSLSAAATCISRARVAIAVSWSIIAKPLPWGSMPVMWCSLLVPGAGGCGVCRGGTGLGGRGRGADSRRGARGRLLPRPPGVSCPSRVVAPRGLLGLLGPVRGARPQRGPQGGGGQPCGDGSLACRAAILRVRVGQQGFFPWGGIGRELSLLRGRCVAERPGGGEALGAWAVPRGPPRLPLGDVGSRFPVLCPGGGVHRVRCNVLHHRPACIELVCTQRAFCGLRGPLCHRAC